MENYDKDQWELQERLQKYLIEDEDSCEIIGLRDGAPDDVKAAFQEMMDRMNSTEPIVRE